MTTGDVIYINPADRDRAISLNLLTCPRPEQRGLVVSNIISIFRILWPDAFAAGARMEDIFRNSLHALIEQRRPVSIIALPKGAIGADAAKLLGSLVVLQEKLAALSRADIPDDERIFHFLYAEESQNFIGDFESILSETRKFRYVLALSTQLIENLSRETAASIFANAGNLITFRVANTDAERLRDEFTIAFPGAVIQDLPDYTAYVRTLICNESGCRPAEPVKVATYPPLSKTPGAEWRSKIERTTNERYTVSRAAVDAAITRFLLGSAE